MAKLTLEERVAARERWCGALDERLNKLEAKLSHELAMEAHRAVDLRVVDIRKQLGPGAGAKRLAAVVDQAGWAVAQCKDHGRKLEALEHAVFRDRTLPSGHCSLPRTLEERLEAVECWNPVTREGLQERLKRLEYIADQHNHRLNHGEAICRDNKDLLNKELAYIRASRDADKVKLSTFWQRLRWLVTGR